MTRQASRTDANQQEIVDALRAAGASVQPLHAVGQGVPDLLVGWTDKRYQLADYRDGGAIKGIRYYNVLMEVKTETGKLTPDQVEWHASWRGQVAVVRSVEDALKFIGRA